MKEKEDAKKKWRAHHTEHIKGLTLVARDITVERQCMQIPEHLFLHEDARTNIPKMVAVTMESTRRQEVNPISDQKG